MTTSWSLDQLESRCAIGMSGGFGTSQIPNAHTRKPAFIPRTKRCRKRSKLRPRCCSSRTILLYSIGGLRKTTSRLGPTARCSAVRNDRQVMSRRPKCTPTERAAEYLERIAALTGAKPDGHGKYRLKAGRMRFL